MDLSLEKVEVRGPYPSSLVVDSVVVVYPRLPLGPPRAESEERTVLVTVSTRRVDDPRDESGVE